MTFDYRAELFRLLPERSRFAGERVLEVGPKDGLDSLRLQTLAPRELTFVELPKKADLVERWIGDISVPYQIIWGDILEAERWDMDRFALIWCTGVLYHNAEQLRLLRILYELALPGGVLVLESATTRHPLLRRLSVVQVHWPHTYRDSGTVTHLPSRSAIMAWLDMVGWQRVELLPCHSRRIARDRAAFYAVRGPGQ